MIIPPYMMVPIRAITKTAQVTAEMFTAPSKPRTDDSGIAISVNMF